jgi:Gluconate 2-dehydrogenase subunit 3
MVGASALACSGDFLLRLAGCQRKDLVAEVRRTALAACGFCGRRGRATMPSRWSKASEFSWPTAQAFFNTIRTHTMEGMFADPIYGGNKDFAGWRLVGFPGGQPLFTPEDLESTQAFTRESIVGLQGRA